MLCALSINCVERADRPTRRIKSNRKRFQPQSRDDNAPPNSKFRYSCISEAQHAAPRPHAHPLWPELHLSYTIYVYVATRKARLPLKDIQHSHVAAERRPRPAVYQSRTVRRTGPGRAQCTDTTLRARRNRKDDNIQYIFHKDRPRTPYITKIAPETLPRSPSAMSIFVSRRRPGLRAAT